MKTKMIIGMLVASVFAINAVSADAARHQARAITKIADRTVTFVGKAVDNTAAVLWRNKEAVVLCTALAVAATNPEPFVQGATTVATSAVEGATAIVTSGTDAVIKTTAGSGSGFISFLVLAVLFIAGLWLFVSIIKFKFWRAVPLLVIALLLCFGGVASAAMFTSVPEMMCTAPATPIHWWNIITIILFIVAIFIP